MLRTLGIDVLFDVGANVGQYGKSLRAHQYHGRIVSFEPQEGPYAALLGVADADPHWDVLQTALGAGEATEVINISGATGASSLLAIEGRHLSEDPGACYVGTQEVVVKRLDDVASSYVNETSRVGVKLDVQGYEWHVLSGARALLSKAAFVEVELLLTTYYTGQARVDQIISLLYESGLRLAGTDHGQVDEDTGMVSWLDAVFVRHSVP